MDFSRLREGEIVAGLAGIALIIFMFLPWYSLGIEAPQIDLPNIPGIDQGSLSPPEVNDDVSGWDALIDFDGFLITAAAAAGILLAALTAAGRRVNIGGLPRGSITAALGAIATALIVWRLFAQPVPGEDFKAGIFLGLLAALGVTIGAVLSLRDSGHPLLVSVGSGSRPGSRKAPPSGRAGSKSGSSARQASSKPRTRK